MNKNKIHIQISNENQKRMEKQKQIRSDGNKIVWYMLQDYENASTLKAKTGLTRPTVKNRVNGLKLFRPSNSDMKKSQAKNQRD